MIYYTVNKIALTANESKIKKPVRFGVFPELLLQIRNLQKSDENIVPLLDSIFIW